MIVAGWPSICAPRQLTSSGNPPKSSAPSCKGSASLPIAAPKSITPYMPERRFSLQRPITETCPLALRELLARQGMITLPRIARSHSSSDGTVRYVLRALSGGVASNRMSDPKPTTIETVFLPEENRQTICISTQAGCAVDCCFCLTATLGLTRNLTPGEILGPSTAHPRREWRAAQTTDECCVDGPRRAVAQLRCRDAGHTYLARPEWHGDFSEARNSFNERRGSRNRKTRSGESPEAKLAISLNASSNEQRDQIMPINRKYPIEKLLEAVASVTH